MITATCGECGWTGDAAEVRVSLHTEGEGYDAERVRVYALPCGHATEGRDEVGLLHWIADRRRGVLGRGGEEVTSDET